MKVYAITIAYDVGAQAIYSSMEKAEVAMQSWRGKEKGYPAPSWWVEEFELDPTEQVETPDRRP